MLFAEEIPDTSMLSPDHCCLCNEPAVEIGLFGYPWCEWCSLRGFILQWASENVYPNLPYDTGKIKYASGEGLLSWLAVALIGTDDLVWSMLLAIKIYEREHSSGNLVARNVCERVTPPRKGHYEIQPLTKDQVQQFMQAISLQ